MHIYIFNLLFVSSLYVYKFRLLISHGDVSFTDVSVYKRGRIKSQVLVSMSPLGLY